MYAAFAMLRYIPSLPDVVRAFIMKGCWNAKEVDGVISVLDPIYVLYYIYYFAYGESSLHPWSETKVIMVYDLFSIYWIQFVNILLRIFASMFIKEILLPLIAFYFSCII
jgi:hypothetical protein